MNLTHTTNYKLYNDKVKKELVFSILSDLHFSYKISNKKLTNILRQLSNQNPQYILFVGDIIDSIDMIEENSERQRLLNWLYELGNISPTFITLGSHDFCKKGPNGWIYKFDEDFYFQMNDIKNINVLDNASFEDENVFILGYTQSMDYYYPNINKKKKLCNCITEDKNQMLKELQVLRQLIKNHSSDDKLNLMLVHSPIFLFDSDIVNELKFFDYLISGHSHNGCVPPILYELWDSNKGLIAPNKTLFPSNVRNTLKNKNDKIIVNGPLTTLHECSGLLELANIFFPTYMSTMQFTTDQVYDNPTISIKQKYLRNINR